MNSIKHPSRLCALVIALAAAGLSACSSSGSSRDDDVAIAPPVDSGNADTGDQGDGSGNDGAGDGGNGGGEGPVNPSPTSPPDNISYTTIEAAPAGTVVDLLSVTIGFDQVPLQVNQFSTEAATDETLETMVSSTSSEQLSLRSCRLDGNVLLNQANPTTKDRFDESGGSASAQDRDSFAFEFFSAYSEIAQIVGRNFDYTRLGFWSNSESSGTIFVTGIETRPDDLPTSGQASYRGAAEGFGLLNGVAAYDVIGTATMNADFGTGALEGAFTNMGSGLDPEQAFGNRGNWNDVQFSGTVTDASFAGSTEVATGASGPHAMQADGAGFVEGRFYGPGAVEASGVWTLQDTAGNHVIGAFGAIQQ